MMSASQLLLAMASGLSLSASIAFTALTARIDFVVERSRDPETTARACRLLPACTPCLATLARQKEEFGFDASADWQAVRRREPADSRLALAAALSEEAAGRRTEAEALLRSAAALDKGWTPRWTLASYYYRYQNWEEFWRWSEEAASLAPAEPGALFRLCLAAAGSADEAAARCLGPSEPRMLPAFVEFVTREDPAADVAPLARRLQAQASPTATGQARAKLLSATEALLASGAGRQAHELWEGMARSGILPYRAADENSPLINGGLLNPLDPPGFDWRIYRLDGLETLAGLPAGSLKFTFSGRQAESIPLIEQWVWTPGERSYEVGCEFRAAALEPGPAGLQWRWMAPGGRVEAISQPPATGEDWVRWRFPLPRAREAGLHRLELWAVRPAGLVRLRGEAWIRNVEMARVEAAAR